MSHSAAEAVAEMSHGAPMNEYESYVNEYESYVNEYESYVNEYESYVNVYDSCVNYEFTPPPPPQPPAPSRSIFRAAGLRGFYRGIIPEYCKVVPGMAVAFTSYEALKQMLGAGAAGA